MNPYDLLDQGMTPEEIGKILISNGMSFEETANILHEMVGYKPSITKSLDTGEVVIIFPDLEKEIDMEDQP